MAALFSKNVNITGIVVSINPKNSRIFSIKTLVSKVVYKCLCPFLSGVCIGDKVKGLAILEYNEEGEQIRFTEIPLVTPGANEKILIEMFMTALKGNRF